MRRSTTYGHGACKLYSSPSNAPPQTRLYNAEVSYVNSPHIRLHLKAAISHSFQGRRAAPSWVSQHDERDGSMSGSMQAGPTWKAPPLTSLKLRMAAPSSARLWLLGGMEPGVMPPTSAWWPRDATKNTMAPSRNTGVMTVMSGRCDPPASCGWLDASTSPGCRPSFLPSPSGPQCLICSREQQLSPDL